VAVEHLNVIREVFATRPEAAQALLMLGRLYMKQRRFPLADGCFKDILGVREWRGALWPAALYGRGECAELQRDYAQATVHYERIYVLYAHYKEWAAKAYVARAKCLIKMRETGKARETLEEMLSVPDFDETPSAKEAREFLAKLQDRGRG
jgi:tetratricopeptide (TPR) repeat protein